MKLAEAHGIARLLRFVAHACRVFGDNTLADEWLRTANLALANGVPIRPARLGLWGREAGRGWAARNRESSARTCRALIELPDLPSADQRLEGQTGLDRVRRRIDLPDQFPNRLPPKKRPRSLF